MAMLPKRKNVVVATVLAVLAVTLAIIVLAVLRPSAEQRCQAARSAYLSAKREATAATQRAEAAMENWSRQLSVVKVMAETSSLGARFETVADDGKVTDWTAEIETAEQAVTLTLKEASHATLAELAAGYDVDKEYKSKRCK